MGLFDFFKKKPAAAPAPAKKAAGPARPGKKRKEKLIGTITHTFNKISVAIVTLRAPLKVGDSIHVRGRYTDFTQTVTSMQVDHESIQSAKKGDVVGIKVKARVRSNNKVFLTAV